MGRSKRPPKRVTTTGQQRFSFCTESAPETAPPPLGDDRFKDDDPSQILLGDKRLDIVLREAGMEWVLRLRSVLGRLDYSWLTMRYSARGRQGFHPRTVLGLLLYGLFVRQIALRSLERLSAVDIGAWWVCGGHRLDHSTIGKFVQLHEAALSEEFFAAVAGWVVRQLGLAPGLSSIDGTVVESAGSHWRAIKAEAARLQAAEAQAQATAAPADEEVQAAARAAAAVAVAAEQRCAQRAAQGKSTETVAVVPSDPAAVIQPRKDGAMRPGYKAATLMHEAGVILGQHVHPSSETAAVAPLLEQHDALFATPPPTLLLDGGFHNGSLLGELAEQGIDVLCPSGKAMGDDDWEKRGRKGLFAKSAFAYDEARDAYGCPGGQWLTYTDRGRDGQGREYRRYRTAACAACSLRARCTGSAQGRSVKRYAGEEYKEAMALVLQQPRARAVYGRRMVIAERVHAELRERLGLRRFHRRGLGAVRAEFALYCIAFNLRRALHDPAVLVVFILVWSPAADATRAAAICVIGAMPLISAR